MGFMSTNMRRYYALERRLLELRKSSGSDDPPGADAILDEMDDMWLLLSDAEHKKLNEGPSRTFPSNWGAITGLMSTNETPSCSHCGRAMFPGFVCTLCAVEATDDLETLLSHRAALDAILALCRPDLLTRGKLPAECLNDPDYGETVRQAVVERLR